MPHRQPETAHDVVYLSQQIFVKTVKQKIISLFYLLLWVIPLLFILSISVKKEGIHHRMEEELESEDLQTIILPEAAVVWMDKHEIWVNNSMFDIHSKKLENGIYTFTGLYDNDETELVLEQQTNTENDFQQNKMLARLFLCLHNIFYTQAQHYYAFSKKQHTLFYQRPSQLSTLTMEILTPPPQL